MKGAVKKKRSFQIFFVLNKVIVMCRGMLTRLGNTPTV